MKPGIRSVTIVYACQWQVNWEILLAVNVSYQAFFIFE